MRRVSKSKIRDILRKENRRYVFENNVRRSMLLTMVNEGLVPDYQTRLIMEADDDDMKAMEDAVMNAAKKAGAIGKLGIKAIATFMKPIAKQSISVAKDTGQWGIGNIGPALSGMGKFVGKAAGGAFTGIKDVVGGLKSEKDFRTLAEKKPAEFKKIYNSYVEKFKEMELPVNNANAAASLVGIGETDEGKEVLETAASKAGIGIDDLVSQLNLFGQLSKHLDAASEAESGAK